MYYCLAYDSLEGIQQIKVKSLHIFVSAPSHLSGSFGLGSLLNSQLLCVCTLRLQTCTVGRLTMQRGESLIGSVTVCSLVFLVDLEKRLLYVSVDEQRVVIVTMLSCKFVHFAVVKV